jgi:TolB protein
MTDSYRTHVTPIWSPDGKNITFVSDLDERWNTKIYNLNIETRIISPILVGSATNPIWSPDGRYLLYTSGYEKTNLFLWDDTLGKSDLLYSGNFIDNDTPAWSADGQSIVFSAFTTGGESGLFQLPIAECVAQSTECIPHELTVTPAFYRNPHWKPTQSLSNQSISH